MPASRSPDRLAFRSVEAGKKAGSPTEWRPHILMQIADKIQIGEGASLGLIAGPCVIES